MSMNYHGVCRQEEGGSGMVAQVAVQKEDIGFYARVPRIVRVGYQELSHAEKWLYTCLRDLCGEAGKCYRSLRTLAKETGISIGSLCKMIPHLAKVGLIEAVMKGTWFIRIVDIWKANKEHCSKNEHSAGECSEIEQDTSSGVQKMNATCSKNEHGCSNFVTKEDRTKKIESEEDRSLTSVSDARTAYAKGYQRQDIVGRTSLLGDDFDLDALQEHLSTRYPLVDNDNHSHSHVAAIGEEQEQHKMAAPAPALQAKSTKDDTLVQHATMAGTLFPASIPVSREAVKSASTKETKHTAKHKKVDPSAKCDTKEVHQRINERRGYALEERVDLIRENQAIKTWCHLHELAELDRVLDYLQEKDPYWSKPENKHRIGGITLLKETPRVLAILAKTISAPVDYLASAVDTTAAYLARQRALYAGGSNGKVTATSH